VNKSTPETIANRNPVFDHSRLSADTPRDIKAVVVPRMSKPEMTRSGSPITTFPLSAAV
jgi:hypothetical protein